MANDTKVKANRTIQQNVANFEELVSVKRSIYPWDSLTEVGSNFFIECDDIEEARQLKGSVRSSGLNYYMKRKIDLVPVVIAAQLEDKVGVLCTAVPVS